MEIKVDAEELKKLNNILKDFLKKNKLATFQGMVDCGWAIRSKAIELCPWDESHLKQQIAVTEDESKMEVDIGTNVKYAPYVEFGTGIYAENGQGRKTPWKWYSETVKWAGWHWTWGQRPQPFLRPAYYENINKIMDFIKRYIK